MNRGLANILFEDKKFTFSFIIVVVMFLFSQLALSRVTVIAPPIVIVKDYKPGMATVESFRGWDLTLMQWDQLKAGSHYLLGQSPSAIKPAHYRYFLRVNSLNSAIFALFLGLSSVLLPLVLLLLLIRPVWAWWISPTMFMSSLWWISDDNHEGFYVWFLSILILIILVISVLIKRQYFRSGLNAFVGVKSLPFHIPVVYLVVLIVIAATRG
ncbi:hypothetical protein MNBD_GAMMA12-2887 [hydrothermal vent metagenome]|uniref:Uncharacterized protein n=1 Tax=hydrothermal vent metagenome TaxID=652676 RepID=A0A3B0Y377_9ZZZZ